MDNNPIIDSRFQGPPDSGNGGYSCGLLAARITGAAKVRLHVPPPLNREMVITTADDGSVTMHDGATLVASAAPAELDLEPPAAPTLQGAIDASRGYIGFDQHIYPSCFVCGPDRKAGDGLCLFPGPAVDGDWSLLACAWQPTDDLLDESGNVREEFVWAALDCPSYFGVAGDRFKRVLLGELAARIMEPVPGADQLIIICWPLGIDGRKSYGGSAIANQQGEILAYGRGTWIELKSA